jgi:beta-xylosidase
MEWKTKKILPVLIATAILLSISAAAVSAMTATSLSTVSASYPVLETYQVTTNESEDQMPSITQTSDGMFYVTFMSTRTPRGVFVTSSPDGNTWSEPIIISSNAWDDSSIIQGKDGKLYVAMSMRGHIYIANSSDGISWSVPQQVTSGPVNNWLGSLIQANDGTFYLAFLNLTNDIFITTSPDGTVWSEPIQITSDPASDFDPSIIQAKDGRLYIAFNSYRSHDVYITNSSDGITWSTPRQVTSGGGTWAHCGPSIIQTFFGEFYIAVTLGSKVYITTSIDGNTWSTAEQVDTIHTTDPELLQSSDGSVWMTCFSWATGNSDIWLMKLVDEDPWAEINEELDALIAKVNNADMPNIIKQRLIDKLEYAKALKENAKEECEAGNFDGATKKLGVAKSQVESFASMVKITRRIEPTDKASFLADAAEIIGKIDELIEYIETKHKC